MQMNEIEEPLPPRASYRADSARGLFHFPDVVSDEDATDENITKMPLIVKTSPAKKPKTSPKRVSKQTLPALKPSNVTTDTSIVATKPMKKVKSKSKNKLHFIGANPVQRITAPLFELGPPQHALMLRQLRYVKSVMCELPWAKGTLRDMLTKYTSKQ